jgi:hypothetical protein
MRKLLAGLLLAAAAGCEDFTLVGPEAGPPPAEPFMNVSVFVDRFESSRYQLRALFYQGMDSRGQLNELADQMLYVDGDAVRPSAGAQPGVWLYEWEETRADEGVGSDSLELRPPVLTNAPLLDAAVTLPVIGRESPMEITWATGEDLRLSVSAAVGATSQLLAGEVNWWLDLGEPCGGTGARSVFISGRSTYPPELRIPWDWAQSATQPPTGACFRAFFPYRTSSTPYRVDLFVDVQIAWQIRVVSTS